MKTPIKHTEKKEAFKFAISSSEMVEFQAGAVPSRTIAGTEAPSLRGGEPLAILKFTKRFINKEAEEKTFTSTYLVLDEKKLQVGLTSISADLSSAQVERRIDSSRNEGTEYHNPQDMVSRGVIQNLRD